MTYLVTAALVTCAACLALTLDGVIADQWHVVGYVRGVPFLGCPLATGCSSECSRAVWSCWSPVYSSRNALGHIHPRDARRVVDRLQAERDATNRLLDSLLYEITGMAKARLMWPTDLRRRA